MKKRILSLVLTLGLVLTLCPAALAASAGLSNFKSVNTYGTGTFQDVPANTWYTENVKSAYELGLMKGTSSVAFSPDGNITIGSAIALACRLHSIYNTGKADFVQGNPWYQVYVDYAVKNGIITQSQYTNYDAAATRRQFAAILAKALPAQALEKKNTVEDGTIPDLEPGSASYDDIYLLYRAGILTGSDSKGTFQPETTIGRSSVAAIVSRMALTSLRQSITLKAVPVTQLTMSKTTLSLEAGKTATLSVTAAPADATTKNVTWKSSNTSVATVDNGVVTAVKKGTATITATAPSGKTATCKVTVTAAPVEVTGITLSKTSITLVEGDTRRLTATVKPSDATNDSVSWSSSNTSVATVSSGGTVTARPAGTAPITATTSNGKTATCKVTVTPEVEVTSVSVSPSSVTLEAGQQKTLSVSLYPSDATDDSVEWTSSDTSVATVSSSGTVTAVAPGTARITATAASGRYDYCRVTVNASTAIDFSVPELDKNYGPMTIVYRSGSVVTNFLVEDFTFTSGKLSYGQGRLEANVQGSVGSGSEYLYIRINLYDSNGKLLDSDYSSKSVGHNQDFAVQMSFNVEASALEQAASIEFFSYSGDKAVPGLVESETEPEPEPEVDEEKADALAVGYKMNSTFQTAMSHLEPVQGYMQKLPGYSENPHSDAQYILFSISGITSFKNDVSQAVRNCGTNSYWAEVKSMAEDLETYMEDVVSIFNDVGHSTDPTSADISQARNAYLSLLQQWTAIINTSTDVLKEIKA